MMFYYLNVQFRAKGLIGFVITYDC